MSSIVTDPESAFRRLVPSRDPLLRRLEEEANAEKIPIVGPVVGELLFILARATQAASILELGTATGYSAIFLARACAAVRGMLVTIELDPGMAARAQANLDQAGLKENAQIIAGDALAELARLDAVFDLVFMDIEKADYAPALPHCHRLLRPQGLLIVDNVGFEEAAAFNRRIHADPGWRSVSLFSFLPEHSPENDGLCLALRC